MYLSLEMPFAVGISVGAGVLKGGGSTDDPPSFSWWHPILKLVSVSKYTLIGDPEAAE